MAPAEGISNSRVLERQNKNYSLEKSSSHLDLAVKRPSPEYLVRTGSMKNKIIQSSTLPNKQPTSKPEASKKKNNNYAFYNIQAGCFTWQGRAFYKNSYMMQRNEAKSRKSFLSVSEDFRSRHSSKQKLSEKLSDSYVSNTSCEKNKKIPEESQNSLNNSGQIQGIRRKESKLPQPLNDDIKIQTKVKKLDKKDYENYSISNAPINNGSVSCKQKTSEEHLRKEKQNVKKEGDKKLSDDKQTKCQLEMGSNTVNQKNFDDYRLYENWSPRIPSLENICHKYDKSRAGPDDLSSNYDSNRDQLLIKMKEKMKVLVDHQFNIDYEILINNVKGTDIENKLNNFASQSEMEKFRQFIEEFDAVNCLIRGLAGRLAATEDNLDQLSFESDKFDNRWIKLRRKKEKLELQLSEALFIRSTIERRKSKIERMLVSHIGQTELKYFEEFLQEKEHLISMSAELSDKIKLCKKQIIEIELGHSVYPH